MGKFLLRKKERKKGKLSFWLCVATKTFHQLIGNWTAFWNCKIDEFNICRKPDRKFNCTQQNCSHKEQTQYRLTTTESASHIAYSSECVFYVRDWTFNRLCDEGVESSFIFGFCCCCIQWKLHAINWTRTILNSIVQRQTKNKLKGEKKGIILVSKFTGFLPFTVVVHLSSVLFVRP